MLEKEYWESIFIGKLKEDAEMNINEKNPYIRFPIEIVSSTPYDFPDYAIKNLTGFSAELEILGFIDNTNSNEDKVVERDKRTEKLKAFLKNNYLMFKVKRNKHSEYDRYYYNAYDVELQPKEDLKSSNRYIPVPFIRTNEDYTEELLQKLFNNEYIGNANISKEENDCPNFILIGESSNDLPINMINSRFNINKFIVFGPIESFQYSEEYGFKFLTNSEQTFYTEIDNNILGEFYLSKNKVAFITYDVDNLLQSILQERGKTINKKTLPKIEDQDENEFLSVFNEVALSKKLSYDPIDLVNFHTAMKTQSFIILAGMSGTGKSQIVQCYHEALNQFAASATKSSSSEKSKLLFVPVRPFWQDDSDLLGYLDTSQGIYRPGDAGLVDFIIEAYNHPNECYIVCLDEMNLAKVEHYFSQFLSVLERDLKDRVINLYNDKLNGRVYNQNDYPHELTLGQNLYFVGTVNLDESTFQFSDKVLDRANVITLKLSPFKEIRNKLKQLESIHREKTPKNQSNNIDGLRTYIKLQGMKKVDKNDALTDSELELLWELNINMQGANNRIGIGYRIINQIENYLSNLPKFSELSRDVAFDLQVTQRIFTKLRGSKSQLGLLVGTFNKDEYEEGILYKLLVEKKEISDFEKAKGKLMILARELDEYGHTI